MSVQVENLEKNMAKLTIEVSAEDLEKALESAYQKQKKQISVPGFRKGKVPRAMIEKMYGVDVFYEDAANALMQQNYAAAVDESGIDIVRRVKPSSKVFYMREGFATTALSWVVISIMGAIPFVLTGCIHNSNEANKYF